RAPARARRAARGRVRALAASSRARRGAGSRTRATARAARRGPGSSAPCREVRSGSRARLRLLLQPLENSPERFARADEERLDRLLGRALALGDRAHRLAAEILPLEHRAVMRRQALEG